MWEGARRERRRNWASNASPDGTSLDQTSTRCVGSRRRPRPRPCEQRPDPARPRGLVLPAASSRSHPSSRGPPLSCCLCSQHPLHTGPGERGLGHLPQREDSSSHVHRKACAQLFKAALFAVEKTQKNLCLRRANGSADCRARVLWSITQRRKGVPHGARSAVSGSRGHYAEREKARLQGPRSVGFHVCAILDGRWGAWRATEGGA